MHAHNHNHNHSHDHSHGHSSDASRRIGWAFFLNVVFTMARKKKKRKVKCTVSNESYLNITKSGKKQEKEQKPNQKDKEVDKVVKEHNVKKRGNSKKKQKIPGDLKDSKKIDL